MPTPPLATSGMPLAASTAPSWPKAGPSSVPSRPISVTMSAASPMPSNRWASVDQVGAGAFDPAPDGDLVAAGVEPDRDAARVLRGRAPRPARGARPRRCRPPPARRRRRAARCGRLGASARRRRPRHLHSTRSRTISRICSRCVRSPVRAASRSTTWIHCAPAASNSRGDARPGRRRRRSRRRSRPGAGARSGRPAGRWRERGRDAARGVEASEACPWSTARSCLRSSPRRAARGRRP